MKQAKEHIVPQDWVTRHVEDWPIGVGETHLTVLRGFSL